MKNTDLDYFVNKINKDLILKLLYANEEEIRKVKDVLTYLDCITGEEREKIKQKNNIIIECFINSKFNSNYKNLIFNLFHKKDKTILLSDNLEEILRLFVQLNCSEYASNIISTNENEVEIIKQLENMKLITIEELFKKYDLDKIHEIIKQNKIEEFDQNTNVYVYIPNKNNK